MPFIPSLVDYTFGVEIDDGKTSLSGARHPMAAVFDRKPEALEVTEAFTHDGKQLPLDCWQLRIEDDAKVSLRFKRDAFADGICQEEAALAGGCLQDALDEITDRVLKSEGARARYAALTYAVDKLTDLKERRYLRLLRAVLEQEAFTLEVEGEAKDGSGCPVKATLQLQPRTTIRKTAAQRCSP